MAAVMCVCACVPGAVLRRPDAAAWSGTQLTLVASSFMDSLIFAGGTAIPTTLGYCFGLFYSDAGRKLLGADFALRRSTVRRYVHEVRRARARPPRRHASSLAPPPHAPLAAA